MLEFISKMPRDTFRGPLGSHRNYIQHIAFENFLEYCDLVKVNEEQGDRSARTRYKEVRYFLNAVESFNNIPDYVYFDTYRGDWTKPPTVAEFRDALHKLNPCLARVAEIANAYKHCVRGRGGRGKWTKNEKGVLHAADLTKSELLMQVIVHPDQPLEFAHEHRFESIDSTDKAMDEAWAFWIEYVNGEDDIDVAQVCASAAASAT